MDCDERDLFESERSPRAVLLSRLSKSRLKSSSVGIWGSEDSHSCDCLCTECDLVVAAAVVVLLVSWLAKQGWESGLSVLTSHLLRVSYPKISSASMNGI